MRFSRNIKDMKLWQVIGLGLMFTIIGIALILTPIIIKNLNNQITRDFIETNAVVVGYDSDNEGLKAIVVEYKVNRETYRKISNMYSNIPKPKGTQLKIKYNPNDPSDAVLPSESIIIIIIPIIIGSIFVLVGTVVIISSIKKKKRNYSTINQSDEFYDNTIQNNEQDQ
ncbi:MAG: DUF3592 domain-containing protein [Clostridium sp.]|nr:DUF3592 domain-containing protein [Clostridium sp.]MCM1444445.1 DUF3592 domain-containing protein [Candidatus Amulumruptor caecigallinarius]